MSTPGADRVLIITIYTRQSPNPPSTDFEDIAKPPQDLGSALENFQDYLSSSLPSSCSLLESRRLAPTVSQSIYTSSDAQSLQKLRHEPRFKHLEALLTAETVFDLLPPPSPTPQLSSQPSIPNPRFKLALFDMDSTLIDQEVIDELARSINLMPAVAAITARAMNGEIDFSASLIERVALLKGVRANIWDTMKTNNSITITNGARELISGLKAMDVKTAVVSGGFLPMAEWLKGQLGLDYAFANELVVAEANEEIPYMHLSGEVDLEKGIVDAEEKRRVLVRLAEKEGVDMGETIAVGDGSNDLLMMGAAGLGVAWRAKVKVQEKAPARLNGESLEELLYLWGERGRQH